MNFNDLLHTVKAHTNSKTRHINPCTCETLISHREIWEKAPKAVARKVTRDGVNSICIDESQGQFTVYQCSGYTRDEGLFCYYIDEKGRTTKAI